MVEKFFDELLRSMELVDSANYDLDMFPNLVVARDGCWYFVKVEAELSPFCGRLDPKLREDLIRHAEKQGAIACFAPVSIQANHPERRARSILLANETIRFNFEGLEMVEEKGKLN